MKEKDFQRIFSKKNDVYGVFELKICKNPAIRFDSVKDHQIKALIGASTSIGCRHKISDFSLEQKPFDCFCLKNVPAYVVIMFYVPRKKKMVYYVAIKSWIELVEALYPEHKSAKEHYIESIALYKRDYKKL